MAEITISMLRISADGKYLQYKLSCPTDYKFTNFIVSVYLEGELRGKYEIFNQSLFPGIYYGEGAVDLKLLPIMASKVIPAIYKIELIAKDAATTPTLPDIKAEAIISDVNNMYYCMMNDLNKLCPAKCTNQDDTINELIRKYFVLFAHLQAMRLLNLDEAFIYFDLIQKCFANCKPDKKTTSCNCK